MTPYKKNRGIKSYFKSDMIREIKIISAHIYNFLYCYKRAKNTHDLAEDYVRILKLLSDDKYPEDNPIEATYEVIKKWYPSVFKKPIKIDSFKRTYIRPYQNRYRSMKSPTSPASSM